MNAGETRKSSVSSAFAPRIDTAGASSHAEADRRFEALELVESIGKRMARDAKELAAA